MNGLLVIDKPAGMTSRDVVNRVQKWFPHKTKIGHTGTLDPLATGVLVVCVGAATRLADYVQAMGKCYSSRFRLGATSTTDDADGAVTETPIAVPPTRERIDAALSRFIGNVEQVPPAVSALKLGGIRAYELVRRGLGPTLNARMVNISAIRVTGYEWPVLDLEVDCGKGTYIRAVARDLGDVLGCGGLVQTLRRTKVGPFAAEQGIGLDADPASVKLLPMAMAATGMPQVFLEQDEARRLFHGQEVRVAPRPGHRGEDVTVAVMAPGMRFFAIGEDNGWGRLRPVTVFANPDA